MGISTAVAPERGDAPTVDAHEAALAEAYSAASWTWSVTAIERVVLGGDIETDDAEAGEVGWDKTGSDEHARARVEDASPQGLLFRLQEASPVSAGSPGSARLRTLGDTLDLLRAADRLASWLAAKQALLTAEVYHRIHSSEVLTQRPSTDQVSSRDGAYPNVSFMLAAQEIAPLLRIPGRSAHRSLAEALRLTEELPATRKALEAGRISHAQAQVIVEESGAIPAEAVAGFESVVLETAGSLTRPKLARRCRRLREELHPETILVRRTRAEKDRTVSVQPEQDGMAWLGAYLPAEKAHGIFNRVDAAARSLQGPDEPRTLSQLRADVFADVLTHTCQGDPEQGTGFRGVGAKVFVTVPVMTLLGHSRSDWQQGGAAASGTNNLGDSRKDHSLKEAALTAASNTEAPSLDGCEPGLLDGYGPIDSETARNLAAHASSFTRILVHPETGAVLSVGRDRYRPPKHLQDWVRITQPTCIHPGCSRSSWSCEIDHLTPWAHGGETALKNLGPRCKRHHKLKTEGIWPAGQDSHGNHRVTSLGGKTYSNLPEPPPPF